MMLRQIYLTAMGAFVGTVAAASFGHPWLWLGIGMALGLIWSRLAPEPIRTSQPAHRPILARAWLSQVVELRRVSFVIGLA